MYRMEPLRISLLRQDPLVLDLPTLVRGKGADSAGKSTRDHFPSPHAPLEVC